ncbi:MAG: ABC transporter substrate-binding protein [Deltaproteobacteria bacterium]|nr:ABC transporter substrate-binding protein [Deltaproteobacteria bacterium]
MNIRFGNLASNQLHNPTMTAMQEKKLLETAGHTVTWKEYLNGVHAVLALSSGAIDFAVCGVVPVLTVQAQDPKLVILAGANTNGSSLVVNNAIKTIKDLDGKKIATPGLGTLQDAILTQWARENKIRLRRMMVIPANMTSFMQQGNVDGFFVWAPYPAEALANTNWRELLTSHDLSPNHQCCVLVTTESVMRKEPEKVRVLLKAYLDAYKWFLDNQYEFVKLTAKSVGMSEEVVVKALKTVKHPYPPFCDEASMRGMMQSLVASGKIVGVREVDMEPFMKKLYRPELLEDLSGAARPSR